MSYPATFAGPQPSADWVAANTLLDQFEIGIESDTGAWKVGPGHWNDLPYSFGAGVPISAMTVNRTLALTDNGTRIKNSGANKTLTIEDSAVIAYPDGFIVTFQNDAATDATITITTDTMQYVNVGAVTTVTVPQYNLVTLMWNGDGTWTLSGTAGVTTA